MFDINRFLTDYNIPYITSGHKHARPGWINIVCPFCTGNTGWHLGYNIAGEFWTCWRCGFKPFLKVIMELSKAKTYKEAKYISTQYTRGLIIQNNNGGRSTIQNKVCKLPEAAKELNKQHRLYLQNRGLDPYYIMEEWDVVGTDGLCIDYPWRIIVPIYHYGVLVSYQGRSISNKAPLKYKACKSEKEVMPHKNTLFGLDKAIATQQRKVIVVEGVFDVFSFPPGVAVATYGIKYTNAQVNLLARHFEKVIVFFDGEPQANRQALKLTGALQNLNVETILVDPEGEGDPSELNRNGDLPQVLRFFQEL